MPNPRRSTLDDAHIGAIVLVPLHDDAAGHASVLERHHRVEPSLTDHHAAGMLAEMTRQTLHLAPEPSEKAHAIRIQIQPHRRQVSRQRVGRIGELEVVHHLGQPIHLYGIEAERLADLACGTPPTVGDDIGGHRRLRPFGNGSWFSGGRAVRVVLFVHVLNHALAPLAARQVRGRCLATRRALPKETARTAAPSPPDRPP